MANWPPPAFSSSIAVCTDQLRMMFSYEVQLVGVTNIKTLQEKQKLWLDALWV